MTRRIISLFLCAAFAAGSLSLLAACADSGDKDGGNQQEVTKSPSNKVGLDVNFKDLPEEDRIIRMAYVEGGNITLTEHSLVVDETNEIKDDQVDMAVKRRNQTVESQLGVILEAERISQDLNGMTAIVKDKILTQAGEYDILAAYQYYAIDLAATDDGGLLLNLNNLASIGIDGVNADYIDITAPYWGVAYNDALSYKGAYYWLTGDIALRYMGGMYCTFVNSKTYSEVLEATYGDLYDIARKGNWTLDLMMEMAALCYQDVGTTPDAKDAEDKFGYGCEVLDTMEGLAYGAGTQFSYKDPSTGDVLLTFDNQHSRDISTKLVKLLREPTTFDFGGADGSNVMPAFAAGNVAFTVNKVYMSQVYLNEFEDFYLIPAPKYDTNQMNYVTALHDGVTLFGIPIDCKKIPQTAATLELLAAYSTQFVKPAYFDVALKSRYIRDPEAAEMIDLIHASVTTDFVAAWSQSIDNIAHAYRTTSKLDKTYFARRESGWITKLETLTTKLTNAANNASE